MKDKFMIFIKKYWLPLWIVIAAVSSCALFVAAEYVASTNSMKRVVVSTSDQGKMFSSNILVENGNASYVSKYFSQHEEDDQTHTTAPYDVDVYLWNYSLSNLSKWYPTDIDYKVTFALTNLSGTPLTAETVGTRTVQVTKGGSTLGTLTGSTLSFTTSMQTLEHNSAHSAEDHYILKFSGDWDLDNDTEICVQMVADPYNGGDNTKYKDLTSLGAVIGLRKNSIAETSGWQAYLAEASDELSVDSCDGYNLTVTGSGKAKITIKWDPSKLACNRNFYNNTIYSFGTGEVEYTNGTAQIIINADTGSSTNDYRNRYDLQFYKEGSEPSDWSFFNDNGSAVGDSIWLSVKVEEQ